MNTDQSDYSCEALMGQWVTARCNKRYDNTEKPMPEDVCAWLRTAGSESAADETSKPPAMVLGWMVKTVIDPDWYQ